jgi:DNA-binding NtrC family response regulator
VERILVVDDSPATLEVTRRNLELERFSVATAGAVAEALALLESGRFDLVVTDIKMPGVSGLDLVRHVRENLPDTEVMVITGYPSVDGAVAAVKTGADEYVAKPFTGEELVGAVRRSLDKLARRRASRGGARSMLGAPLGLVGDSKAMRRVFDTIGKAARTNATVLITGESGTGKELVARAIHYQGSRAAAPFLPVNCGGIPTELLESELFGHMKGAFTGAAESRAGFFQAAEGGTLFLDEVAEMPFAMQAKLLRVLHDHEVCMVGSTRPRKVDVRVVAATHQDLPSAVAKGSFREDLYYRLNVVTVPMPPLRERADDVVLLAGHFVTRYAAQYDKPALRFTDQAIATLKSYPWPGNVRELENLVQRLTVMADSDRVDVTDLPDPMRFHASRSDSLTRTLAEVEADYARRVLASVGGNRSRAARILGIDRKTLRAKLGPTP